MELFADSLDGRINKEVKKYVYKTTDVCKVGVTLQQTTEI